MFRKVKSFGSGVESVEMNSSHTPKCPDKPTLGGVLGLGSEGWVVRVKGLLYGVYGTGSMIWVVGFWGYG